MKYSIAEIINESMTELKGHISDVIYFNGCTKNCCYCFNKELKEYKEKTMTEQDIIDELSDMSDYVVLTGGEPLARYLNSINHLIQSLHIAGKKVFVETSIYDDYIWKISDGILYTAKTFRWKKDVGDWIEVDIKWADDEKVTLCVVTEHDCFDEIGYYILKQLFQNEIIERGAVNGDY